MRGRLIATLAIVFVTAKVGGQSPENPAAADVAYSTDVIVSGLKIPSAIAFLPDGRALVAEREIAAVELIDLQKRTAVRLEGVPPAVTGDDAGIHDIVLHPDFRTNGWIYITYSEGDPSRSTTVVDRVHLRGRTLTDGERIFAADAFSEDRYHYGGRLAFANGYMFLTVGDRHHESRAQQLSTDAGKILRLHDDGRVPADNPYVGTKGARPEIWSYGHRNPQGLAFDPRSGVLWENEHGPLGGDELNIVERGANYGWPVISYGWQYDGGPIGQGIVSREGMKQPLWVWTPAIAPSGLLLYTGTRFPQWRGSFFIGAMAQRHLNRLTLRDGRVVAEERLLIERKARVRCVAEGLDGLLYVGADSGELVRVAPAGSRKSD